MPNTGIEHFAAGGQTTGSQRWDPEFSETLIEYLERESDFRQFTKVVQTNSFAQVLPIKYSKGIAVEVVEGAEIPKEHNVYDHITVNVRQNGTGIRMTDEEQLMMAYEDNYFQKEAVAAMKRLLKKENKDISEVLLAGAGITYSGTATKLEWEDIIDFKTDMESQEYIISPKIIVMSPQSYNDLVKDPKFRDYSQSGIGGVLESGQVGRMVDGMQIYIIPEVEDNVYLIDTDEDPLWLVQMGQVKTEKYRLSETREDVLDITLYSKPAILRPDAIGVMNLTRNPVTPPVTPPEGDDGGSGGDPVTPPEGDDGGSGGEPEP